MVDEAVDRHGAQEPRILRPEGKVDLLAIALRERLLIERPHSLQDLPLQREAEAVQLLHHRPGNRARNPAHHAAMAASVAGSCRIALLGGPPVR